MPKADIYDLENNKVDEIELSAEIFEFPVKEHLMHEVVNWQLASMRSGSASTKTRGEVRGGGAKPWKQKNIGRARQGSIRAPHWRKGGVTFGPQPKDWSYNIPKKIKKQALKSALSFKFQAGKILIINEVVFPEIKTKQVVNFIKNFSLRNALLVTDNKDENLTKSSRNLKIIKVLSQSGINVYDILKYDSLVLTKSTVNYVQEVLAN